MNLEKDKEYIISPKRIYRATPIKIKVLEVTETTYYLQFEEEYKKRYDKDILSESYNLVEQII